MLTVHDVTLNITWKGWGSQSYLVERVAEMEMFDLLQKTPDAIGLLARSKHSMMKENDALRYAVRRMFNVRGKPIPINGVITLEVVNA